MGVLVDAVVFVTFFVFFVSLRLIGGQDTIVAVMADRDFFLFYLVLHKPQTKLRVNDRDGDIKHNSNHTNSRTRI